jgi:hypothetical protein
MWKTRRCRAEQIANNMKQTFNYPKHTFKYFFLKHRGNDKTEFSSRASFIDTINFIIQSLELDDELEILFSGIAVNDPISFSLIGKDTIRQ